MGPAAMLPLRKNTPKNPPSASGALAVFSVFATGNPFRDESPSIWILTFVPSYETQNTCHNSSDAVPDATSKPERYKNHCPPTDNSENPVPDPELSPIP